MVLLFELLQECFLGELGPVAQVHEQRAKRLAPKNLVDDGRQPYVGGILAERTVSRDHDAFRRERLINP